MDRLIREQQEAVLLMHSLSSRNAKARKPAASHGKRSPGPSALLATSLLLPEQKRAAILALRSMTDDTNLT